MGEISINPKFNIHETYKKVRILNPYRNASPIGGVDPDYQAVLDYAAGNFIALPDAAQQDLDNQVMIGLKNSGGWAKNDVILKFKGTATPAFKLICWKRVIETTPFGGLIWSNSGVKGNTVDTYINPQAPLSTLTNYTRNNASVSFFVEAVGGDNSSTIYALYGPSSTYSYNLINVNYPSASMAINSVTNTTTSLGQNSIGFISVNRISATQIKLIAEQGVSINDMDSKPLQAVSPYILARNRADNGTVDGFSDVNISYFFMGANIENEHNAIKAIL